MTPCDLHLNGTVIRYNPRVLSAMEPKLFDPSWLRANHRWQGATQGRSQAHFFHYAGHDMVLRHFHRGGLVGRVNRDLYLRVQATKSRAFREFDLLEVMHDEALPVPVPIAARYVPYGPFYRADIITQRIPNARPLLEVLEQRALPSDLWEAIGAEVRTLHDHRVFHSDLNGRNILIDDADKVWFIDFDKCEKRPPGPWMQANIDRLKRSLAKAVHMSPTLHWCAMDWASFELGYAAKP